MFGPRLKVGLIMHYKQGHTKWDLMGNWKSHKVVCFQKVEWVWSECLSFYSMETMSLIIRSINNLSANDKKHITCIPDRLTGTCTLQHVSRFLVHHKHMLTGCLWSEIYHCLLQITSIFCICLGENLCVSVFAQVHFGPGQPKLSARTGPQGQGACVCMCLCKAHTCLPSRACVYSNIHTHLCSWLYRTCHCTRQEMMPEEVCLPRKSLSRVFSAEPQLWCCQNP